jgi:hypothetical protein
MVDKTKLEIEDLFASIRGYARQQQISVLELIAEYALDDLPISIAQTIREYLAERSPKVEPGQVEYRSFFVSGRPDISEHMAEFIYGPEMSEDA